MQFPKSYYEDEVREGFYIAGRTKCAWAAHLEVLEEVAKVCKKHNIRWFADCGTLLGAVRHGGYIPWDDDLDICMLRDDYMRFQEIAEQELGESFFLLTNKNYEDHCEINMRVSNSTVYCMEDEFLNKYHNFPYPAGVDIFPLDYVAPTPEAEEQRIKLARLVYGLTLTVFERDMDTKDAALEGIIRSVEKACNIVIDRKKSIKRQLFQATEKVFSMYGPEESNEVVLINYWLKDQNHKYPLEYFENTIELPFEGIKVLAPAAYDGVLRIEYGDYMKIVHAGGVHEYPYYKKQAQYIEESQGIRVEPRYEFSKEDLIREEVPERRTIRTTALEHLELFCNVHEEIRKCLIQENWEEVLELLGVAQEGAIQLGNQLDEEQGEDCKTVRHLEKYCELLFLIFEAITQGSDMTIDDIIMALQEISEQIEKSIWEDIKVKKEVVFLPYKASAWESMESIWRAAYEDPDCDVYVIPVPRYEKRVDGCIGDLQWDGDLYPDYVPITHYEQYGFESRKPDVIFINSPYDEYNGTIGIPGAFYSRRLKKCTNQLIYIPYFTVDEIEPADEKAVYTMNYFVTMPGVVHADKVIVQSENMRQTYIERLVEFAGEDTRHIWEEKIVGLGSPLMDKKSASEFNMQQIPEEWKKVIQKPDGSNKKIILYYNSISIFQQYGQQVIEKMQKVFQTFREQQEEVAMLWRPDSLIEVVLKQTQPKLWEEYQNLQKQFLEEGWGIYDASEDVKRAVAVCDGYYGDTGSVAQMCRLWEKPVMLQMV